MIENQYRCHCLQEPFAFAKRKPADSLFSYKSKR